MAQRVREHDWSATPLGPAPHWGASLRTAVQIVLAHPLPAIVLWGRELIQIYNDTYRDLMGVKHPAGLGQPTRACWSEVWHINAPIYERVWQGESVSLEDALFPITRSGRLEDAWFSLTYSPVRDESDCVAGVLVTITETTRRLRAEAAQRQSEERLRLAIDAGELATWDWDLHTGRVVWSDRHYRMDGYAPGEIEPSYEAWVERVHPQDRAGAEGALQEAREHRLPYGHEFRAVHPDGSVHWLSAQGHFLYDAQGRAVRMIGVMREVTGQHVARELLEQRVAERTLALRQLLQRLETVQDDERRRIARELHDGLGQYLSSVTLALGSLRGAPHEAAAPEQVRQLHGLAQQLERELDRIVFLLRPTALEDGGLAEGVAAHAQTWSERTGVAVDLELHGLDGHRLEAALEAAVFRVVREALDNVARHARASRVGLGLERRRGQLVGSIEDDGIGFEPADAAVSPATSTGWGLAGMRERIEALGGQLLLESQPGRGTTVLLRVPLDRRQEP